MLTRHLSPTCIALFAGLLYLQSPGSASAAPPTITVVSPTPGAVVGDSVDVKVDIQSVYQISAVKAQTTFGSTNLTSNGTTTWSGTIPLKGAAWGNQTISFTATYSLNQQVVAQVTALHDLPPTITLGAPRYGVITADNLSLDATCTDDGPSGCTLEVLYRGQSVASGPSPLKKTVSLASFSPSSFVNADTRKLTIQAKDSSGQVVATDASVWVMPPHPGRVEVDSVPGKIIDFNEGWILYEDPQARHLYSRVSKQDVFSASRSHEWSLASNGVVLVGSGATDDNLNLKPGIAYHWKNGALTSLGDEAADCLVGENYAVRAYVSEIPSDPWDGRTWTMKRHDLRTGAEKVLYNYSSTLWSVTYMLSVSPGGDVYTQERRGGGAAIIAPLYRYAATSGSFPDSSTSCDLGSNTLASNDHLAGLLCDQTYFGDGPELIIRDLATSTNVVQYKPDVNFYPMFGLADDWVAYERIGNGIVQVWRRYPTGQEEQVSAFPESSHFVSIGPNGEIVFSHGSDMWVATVGAEPVAGAPYRFLNGEAYFMVEGSLFHEGALTGGGSSTGTGAGGADGAGGASGTSTSGAGGASGTSTSGASGTSTSGASTGASGVGAGGSTGESASTGSTGSGSSGGGSSSSGCSASGGRGASSGLEGLGLLGLAALVSRSRRRGRVH